MERVCTTVGTGGVELADRRGVITRGCETCVSTDGAFSLDTSSRTLHIPKRGAMDTALRPLGTATDTLGTKSYERVGVVGMVRVDVAEALKYVVGDCADGKSFAAGSVFGAGIVLTFAILTVRTVDKFKSATIAYERKRCDRLQAQNLRLQARNLKLHQQVPKKGSKRRRR